MATTAQRVWCSPSSHPNGTHLTIPAVARTPSSLQKLMLSNSVPEDILTNNLTITQGDIRDIAAVSTVLAPNGVIVDAILCGIGGVFTSIFGPYPDFTVCRAAGESIPTALSQLRQSRAGTYKAPYLISISTTGITSGPRDVPLLLYLPYKVLLHAPHVDKALMETMFAKAAAEGTLDVTIVRASLLTSGATLGRQRVRVGTEKAPAVGYTISRGDVGIYDALNSGAAPTRGKWKGEKVTLTY